MKVTIDETWKRRSRDTVDDKVLELIDEIKVVSPLRKDDTLDIKIIEKEAEWSVIITREK